MVIRHWWHRLFDYHNLRDRSLEPVRSEIISNFYRDRSYRIDLATYYSPNRLW